MCATENQEKKYLQKLLGNKRLVTSLLYRGSIDGWKHKDFHSRCDNKGPTITLMKVKDGDCIGGFTKAKWSPPPYGQYFEDSDSLLFNLSCFRRYPPESSESEKKVILCQSIKGPCFGGGEFGSELGAVDAPFNCEGNCYSWVDGPSYCIPVNGAGKNMLTNKMNNKFTISELEVWEIIYEKRSQSSKV